MSGQNPTRSATWRDKLIENLDYLLGAVKIEPMEFLVDTLPWKLISKPGQINKVTILYLYIVDDDVFRSQRHNFRQTCSWHFDLQNKLKKKQQKQKQCHLLSLNGDIVSVAVYWNSGQVEEIR